MSKIQKKLDPDILCSAPTQRERLEAIRGRIDLLDEHDRMLIKMYLDNGNSCRQISSLMGTASTTVSRRIAKILFRLMNKDFTAALKSSDTLTKKQMAIARDYFVRGLSIRELTAKYKTSYHNAWKILRNLKTLGNNNKYQSAANKERSRQDAENQRLQGN